MNWYAIYTKSRQEKRANENLLRQGFECYLPTVGVQKLVRKRIVLVREPLFPRYLFICLDADGAGKGWGTIRSTRGVTCLVTFGGDPARVDNRLIAALRAHEGVAEPHLLYKQGEQVRVTSGPFAGIKGIFQISDPGARAVVLIELLGAPTKLRILLKDIVRGDAYSSDPVPLPL